MDSTTVRCPNQPEHKPWWLSVSAVGSGLLAWVCRLGIAGWGCSTITSRQHVRLESVRDGGYVMDYVEHVYWNIYYLVNSLIKIQHV